MKTSILICATIISLTLVACGQNTANQEFNYETIELSSKVLTESEKDQATEKRLIERLQTIIEMFDNVNEAVISMDGSNESEKTVDVLIITEPNSQLTDEEKSGIANIIKDSVNGTVAVDIKEEQRTD